ncbi:amidase [Microbacterium marinilacus]|uniref:Amidase n=1 Tax=Microbacterium marinilacus TaxID=415209 RepID=A0ABP7B938_9MICO|nr:amidase family protein [Microbacterium marinilacus]MBY0687377.1 amidase [Microbacterium marinilacus]
MTRAAVDGSDDICRAPARTQLALLETGVLSAAELLAEHLARIDAVNGQVNAVVSIDRELAVEAARASDRRRADGSPRKALEGLPTAFKDLEEAAGLRTTWGSPRFAHHVSAHDSDVVARIRAAGAVPMGKTNTPEFGTGSHTQNDVFGVTRNPYDTSRSAGGSSGGAAAALAAGMLPIADGSDLGGSLRNPASFCNVVGFRPTPGLVPNSPGRDLWNSMPVKGPMARTVRDAALLLAVLAGPSATSPLSSAVDGSRFAAVAETSPDQGMLRGLRVAWSPTVGGLDIDPRVRSVLEQRAVAELRAAGAIVVERDLVEELEGVDEAFRILRAHGYAASFRDVLASSREVLSPELIANTEWGLDLTAADLARAEDLRMRAFQRFAALFAEIDVVAAPAAAVPPFPIEERWVREIDGVAQSDYLQWMRAAWRFTPLGGASMSLPCGFTDDGLPVGLQLVTAPRNDELLLRVAAAFEERVPAWREPPRVLHAAAQGTR